MAPTPTAANHSPERVGAAAVLAALPEITAARLRRVMGEWPDPQGALAAVRAGETGRVIAPRPSPGTPARLARLWRAHVTDTVTMRARTLVGARETGLLLGADAGYPIDVTTVADHPALLLAEGRRAGALEAPRVAIVGTRAATPHGLADAHQLGAELAEAGVTIVSGMAIGIDAAAHSGALDAGGRTVGVVATGLDIEYPRRHRSLYERVRADGLVVSELGFGTQPSPERFPTRNRIIAALADITVVVEATVRGGARITAEHALRYGRDVFAMPGSRRNPAAQGCNELIRDGAQPLLDTDDVLLGIGMTPGARRTGSDATPARPPLSGDAQTVHHALGGEPATLDELAQRTNLPLGSVAEALCRLTRDRWAHSERGQWWPR
ncbi:MAG TPA: DNA-processing protein DprA [Acidimicrobiia bacterium]|nr:DNA-processing protein DprA [Acidimicrobiia bacterium]